MVFLSTGILANLAAWSQGVPPAGPMPPAADTAEEAAAKKVVQQWGALIDAGKVEEAFQQYVSQDFNDHSNTPRRMTGKQKIGYAEALEAFVKFIGPRPGTMVEQVYANENMVTIKGKVGRDLFLVKDGKITDHWDTLQEPRAGGPAPSPASAR